jgi:hypothetical protein
MRMDIGEANITASLPSQFSSLQQRLNTDTIQEIHLF